MCCFSALFLLCQKHRMGSFSWSSAFNIHIWAVIQCQPQPLENWILLPTQASSNNAWDNLSCERYTWASRYECGLTEDLNQFGLAAKGQAGYLNSFSCGTMHREFNWDSLWRVSPAYRISQMTLKVLTSQLNCSAPLRHTYPGLNAHILVAYPQTKSDTQLLQEARALQLPQVPLTHGFSELESGPVHVTFRYSSETSRVTATDSSRGHLSGSSFALNCSPQGTNCPVQHQLITQKTVLAICHVSHLIYLLGIWAICFESWGMHRSQCKLTEKQPDIGYPGPTKQKAPFRCLNAGN